MTGRRCSFSCVSLSPGSPGGTSEAGRCDWCVLRSRLAVRIRMLRCLTKLVLQAHTKLECDRMLDCVFKRCSFGATVSWERQHLVRLRA